MSVGGVLDSPAFSVLAQQGRLSLPIATPSPGGQARADTRNLLRRFDEAISEARSTATAGNSTVLSPQVTRRCNPGDCPVSSDSAWPLCEIEEPVSPDVLSRKFDIAIEEALADEFSSACAPFPILAYHTFLGSEAKFVFPVQQRYRLTDVGVDQVPVDLAGSPEIPVVVEGPISPIQGTCAQEDADELALNNDDGDVCLDDGISVAFESVQVASKHAASDAAGLPCRDTLAQVPDMPSLLMDQVLDLQEGAAKVATPALTPALKSGAQFGTVNNGSSAGAGAHTGDATPVCSPQSKARDEAIDRLSAAASGHVQHQNELDEASTQDEAETKRMSFSNAKIIKTGKAFKSGIKGRSAMGVVVNENSKSWLFCYATTTGITLTAEKARDEALNERDAVCIHSHARIHRCSHSVRRNMHTHMYIRMNTHTCAHTHAHTRTHTRTHTHTHACIRTHGYICCRKSSR